MTMMKFNFQTFAINALAVKDPKKLYQINKAKKLYLKDHKECAICGNQQFLEVHHVIPVHQDINISDDLNNLITLCDAKNNGCHRWIGHFGDFKNYWNIQVREYAVHTRLFLEKEQPNRVFIIPTATLVKEFSQSLGISDEQFLVNVKAL